MCVFLNEWQIHSGSQPQKVIVGDQKQIKLDELPLFDFSKLATATNNFHLGNMLGKGGFGLVYKVIQSKQCLSSIILYCINQYILDIFHYFLGAIGRWPRNCCKKTIESI